MEVSVFLVDCPVHMPIDAGTTNRGNVIRPWSSNNTAQLAWWHAKRAAVTVILSRLRLRSAALETVIERWINDAYWRNKGKHHVDYVSPRWIRWVLHFCLKTETNISYCDDHSSLSSTTAVEIWIISCILHGKYELNKLTSFPMCGFIAQLTSSRRSVSQGAAQKRAGEKIKKAWREEVRKRLIAILVFSFVLSS